MIKDLLRNVIRCIRCYMCNIIEGFFVILCDGCYELNEEMKWVLCDLYGRYVIVIGGWIKIGLEMFFKLFRDGVFVFGKRC